MSVSDPVSTRSSEDATASLEAFLNDRHRAYRALAPCPPPRDVEPRFDVARGRTGSERSVRAMTVVQERLQRGGRVFAGTGRDGVGDAHAETLAPKRAGACRSGPLERVRRRRSRSD